MQGLNFEHDTMDGSAVQVRLYIQNPSSFTKDTMTSGYIKGAGVEEVQNHFTRWFANKLRVVRFDQQNQWEAPVQVAARLDLTGMDAKNLHFYSYDTAANSYRPITAPAHWIDTNGYLRFTTPLAGSIIVAEGPLVKR
jgi:hypothetical protein